MKLHTRELGAGEPVIVLHGLFGSSRNLTGLSRALSTRHRVLAMDLRNHGTSPHDPAMTYRVMADDVRETMASFGLSAASIVGHSMGGKVAMTLALRAGACVRRLVVADIAPVSYPSHFGAFVPAMRRITPDMSRAVADAALAPDIADKTVRDFLLSNYRPGEGWQIGLAEIAANLPAIEAWQDGHETYGGPALFVVGERSDYVREQDHAVIRRYFPNAAFASIAGAGHWLHAENPRAFNDAVGSFISLP